MQLEDALVEETPEASFSLCAVIPLTIDDFECNVFVRRTCNEPDNACVVFASFSSDFTSPPSTLTLDLVGGRTSFVQQIWVEDIELVALDNFGRRVVVVVVCLVLLVSFVAENAAVEVLRLAWSNVCRPEVLVLGLDWDFCGDQLFVIAQTASNLTVKVDRVFDVSSVSSPLPFRRRLKTVSRIIAPSPAWNVTQLQHFAPVVYETLGEFILGRRLQSLVFWT